MSRAEKTAKWYGAILGVIFAEVIGFGMFNAPTAGNGGAAFLGFIIMAALGAFTGIKVTDLIISD